jgi:hypothetical protein
MSCGIALDQNDIRQLPRGNAAQLIIFFHNPCRSEGGELQDLWGRNSGFLVKFELSMQGESRQRIGSRDDGHTGIVQSFRHLQHLREGILIALIHSIRNFQASVEEAATNLRRQAIGDCGIAV